MMTNLMTILERKAFISSNPRIVLSSCPPPCGHFSIQESASGGLSYKVKKQKCLSRIKSLQTFLLYLLPCLIYFRHRINIQLPTIQNRSVFLCNPSLDDQWSHPVFRSPQSFHDKGQELCRRMPEPVPNHDRSE